MEFWKREYKCPITEEDRLWVEDAMLSLMEMFGADYLKAKDTILPTKDFFDYDFKGESEDAQFVLKRLYELMDIDDWEISLRIKALPVTSFDVKGSPSGGISTSWKGASGTYQDKGFGTMRDLKDIPPK
jgi:hypothetical protein